MIGLAHLLAPCRIGSRLVASCLVGLCLAGVVAQPALAQIIVPGPAPPPASDPVLLDPHVTVRCGSTKLEPVYRQDIGPLVYGQAFMGSQVGQRIAHIVYRFDIDATGRPFGIRGVAAGTEPVIDVAISIPRVDTDFAVQAALAAWQFPAQTRNGCLFDVAYTPVSLSRADTDLLARYYAVTRTSGSIRSAVQRRLQDGDASCSDLEAIRRSYPDYRIGRSGRAGQSWTLTVWRIGADGRPEQVRTLASSGDEAFDAEVRRATADTLYAPGTPEQICVYNHFRRVGFSPAPPLTEQPARILAADLLADCPADLLPGLTYRNAPEVPANFASVGIAGRALIRFDLAPWGKTGNVAVVEAQPAAAFGDQAVTLIEQADTKRLPRAGIRCLLQVDFPLSSDDGTDDPPPTPNP